MPQGVYIALHNSESFLFKPHIWYSSYDENGYRRLYVLLAFFGT